MFLNKIKQKETEVTQHLAFKNDRDSMPTNAWKKIKHIVMQQSNPEAIEHVAH